MESYDDYTALEMLQLLDILQREPFPTANLYRRKEELFEKTAARLDLEPKEIQWIVENPHKKQRAAKEEKVKERQERDHEESKLWKILTQEIMALGSSMRKMGENLSSIKKKVVTLEKSYQQLAVQENEVVWENEDM